MQYRNRDSAEPPCASRLMGCILALDAIICVIHFLLLANNGSADKGMMLVWLIGAVVFGVAAQRELAHAFRQVR